MNVPSSNATYNKPQTEVCSRCNNKRNTYSSSNSKLKAMSDEHGNRILLCELCVAFSGGIGTIRVRQQEDKVFEKFTPPKRKRR